MFQFCLSTEFMALNLDNILGFIQFVEDNFLLVVLFIYFGIENIFYVLHISMFWNKNLDKTKLPTYETFRNRERKTSTRIRL